MHGLPHCAYNAAQCQSFFFKPGALIHVPTPLCCLTPVFAGGQPLYVHHVAGDGSCWHHSIAAALTANAGHLPADLQQLVAELEVLGPQAGADVRRRLVQWLRTLGPDHFMYSFLLDLARQHTGIWDARLAISAFLRHLAQPGSWAGAMTLPATAWMLGVNIQVYTLEGGEWHWETVSSGVADAPTIYITQSFGHFEPLLPTAPPVQPPAPLMPAPDTSGPPLGPMGAAGREALHFVRGSGAGNGDARKCEEASRATRLLGRELMARGLLPLVRDPAAAW